MRSLFAIASRFAIFPDSISSFHRCALVMAAIMGSESFGVRYSSSAPARRHDEPSAALAVNIDGNAHGDGAVEIDVAGALVDFQAHAAFPSLFSCSTAISWQTAAIPFGW